ncbi:hypothetical protein PPIS_b1053 [Pseudoalteromonas piscicida]|uniref:Uncharacterized protein n=1 Tax=Pseudoalteromonas piscicida TaxID=43662 RepID=A0ABN5CT07_PSEO7|nr:hypothetical protein PPIS_b1053 [Pseudoalteromonas piscicida]
MSWVCAIGSNSNIVPKAISPQNPINRTAGGLNLSGFLWALGLLFG